VKEHAARAATDPSAQRIELSGDWTLRDLPDRDSLLLSVAERPGTWSVDLAAVSDYDDRLSALLLLLSREVARAGSRLRLSGATQSQQRLLDLATAVEAAPRRAAATAGWLSRQQLRGLLHDIGESLLDSLAFLGATVIATGRTLAGRGAMRRRELLEACYRAGPNALGIISLTSVLVGMILAYLGAAQLQQFGAAIYVADLVAIGMLREMGALMSAVVMSGRTGAAYAAQLSTMQGNEEIDAIRTLGIDPIEYLVVPRVIALVCMMPLLVIVANVLGIAGGALVAGGMGVTPLQYLSQLDTAVTANHFLVGMAKSLVFALLIAIAGCRAGISAGRSSAAVGTATTEAVVTAVVYLIVADAAINILCQQLSL
jgi:phospholipid/cholesterol/gamma-HCH transport system permease protein